LLDAALQASGFVDSGSGLRLPFSWTGLTLHALGATTLRVRLRPTVKGVAVEAWDGAGQPVLSVRELTLRAVDPDQLAGRPAARDSLFRLDWTPLALPETPDEVGTAVLRFPETEYEATERLVLLCPSVTASQDDVVTGAHDVSAWLLDVLQQWLRAPEPDLVVVTSGAVAVGPEDVPNLADAPVWGLIRSAQSEHPGRITLVDTDNPGDLTSLLALGEPQGAVRAGEVRVPRLVRAIPAEGEPDWGDGAVLITGGTGVLGGLVAQHLVAEHGVGRVVLLSRQGEQAAGAAELRAELAGPQTGVEIVACDATDRTALAATWERINATGPVTAVVHTAGTLDDGVLDSLSPERLHTVLAPKVDAAWHLHELSAEHPLSAFVLFSSAASVFGGAGQANYAAANAFCDALAAHRRAHGLPGLSLAWGLWEQRTGLTAHLGDGQVSRMGRGGIRPMSSEHALGLLDLATAQTEALLVPASLDRARIRATGEVPALLRALVRPVRTRAAANTGLSLAGLSPAERQRAALDLVRAHVAIVLGHASPEAILPDRAFGELGFDSLTAVELRNALSRVLGTRLPATLIFDYPTPDALARFLVAQVNGSAPAPVSARVAGVVDEPIAIVGMSCRFPGNISTPEELWRFVVDGADGIDELPADRGWDLAGLIDPDPEHAGTSYTAQGGFVYDAGDFDPGFFGISPREALAMDPQQRLLLETAWEVFERAGIDPASVRGSSTGVFVGMMYHDYATRLDSVPDGLEGYVGNGNAGSVASGRVAYALGLEGPAITVDTACSSSLVALHLAGQALRQGECDLALAGGVTVMSSPQILIEFSRQRGLAVDGRCKSFAASADGTGFSEGVGLLLVERLSDARRHGHQVLAVVRGSAVNQDGASNGLTAPNGPSQQRVIRQALANARLSTSDVDVVEAHGTGTTLGDPIEAQALLATYGQDRETPLLLGSIKSNLGHTQAAAGVAGVIKIVQALRHGTVPATRHVDEPTPHVDWSAGAVELVTEQRPWPAVDRPRRAGVSAFGVSGTNAHVVLEQAPAAEPVAEAPVDGVLPWIISARSDAALRGQAARLRDFALTCTEDPAAIGRSLITSRALFEYRAVVLGETRDELVAGLDAVIAGESEVARPLGRGPVFVFPGQGAQWVGMGRELLESSTAFRESMRACATALESYVDWSLLGVLSDEAALARVDVVQPVSWAVMVSLAAVWRSYGVEPAAVVGHSQGEIAAACVAGFLSLDDGARIVAMRSKALVRLSGTGGMVWLPLAADDLDDRLSVAAVNGPRSTVVSGDPEALEELLARIPAARRISVDYASHSVHVDPLRNELLSALDGIVAGPGEIGWLSTVTGEWIDPAEVTAGYWFENLRRPVRFHEAVQALREHRVFIEVSPHPVLAPAIEDEVVVVGTLRRDQPERRTLLGSLAQAFVRGVPVDWAVEFPPGRTVALPTYAFQHERFWLQSTARPAGSGHTDGEFWDIVERGDIAGLSSVLGTQDDLESWRAVLPALTRWRERKQLDTTVGNWCYQVAWRPLSLKPDRRALGAWLVVAPEFDEIASECVRALREHGADVRRITSMEDVSGVDGVISLLDLAGTLDLAQRLDGTRLWCVTRSAVSVSASDVLANPDQAMVWGLGRVLGLEHPDRWGGLIDVPAVWDDRARGRFVAALSGGEFAIRASGVFGRRLHRMAASGSLPELGGPVLITGGTGGLGARVARWLAGRGVPELILVSRRGADAPGADSLAAELNCRVRFAACDVSDRAALAEVIDSVPDLKGVVHTAAVLDDGVLAGLTPERLDTVLGPKARGAWHLHELTRQMDLSLFVLFSSLAGVAGGAGQGNYAAANAYLDALAEHRRQHGLTATSIAWGRWAGEGLAADEKVGARLGRSGVPAMDPDLALRALERILGQPTAVIANIDWNRFLAAVGTTTPNPFFDDFQAASKPVKNDLAARIAPLPPKERQKVVLGIVRDHVAGVLGHASAQGVPAGRTFAELGIDSLTAVELRNVLRAGTGLALPATLVFDYPTPERVAEFLVAELVGSAAPTTAVTVRSAADEPIAIVGMSCRYPGNVTSVEDLWRLVFDGADAVGEFPTDRGWDAERLFDPDPDHAGTMYTQQGGFVYNAGDFDPAFFGISPREALAMDPQQRLLLEAAWEVFERAGITPRSMRGSHTGVFVGSGYQGYGSGFTEFPEGVEGYALTGGSGSVLSGRIAYTLGLEGPAVTVDTACSSSLVALHLAAQALRQGECTMALAGGVTVMATPGPFVEFSRQRGLAADGRCKAFAAAADGTGWAEGVGLLLVERLSDAKRHGHAVLAVIRGSAVNQDGASNGLTAPNGPSQQRVIRQALANAGLGTADVDVVEAHGTGTMLGDPIEAQALLATYGQDRETPLLLGSVKSNIGHTQSAAGVAGMIKMVLALRHGIVPATLHVDKPSPHVEWSAGAVELVTERRDWPAVDRPRRAAVSAFGVSGTNAHLILEQAPPVEDPAAPEPVSGPLPWVLSGRTEKALREQAARLRDSATDAGPAEIGAALVRTRTVFEHRAVVLGNDTADLFAGLDRLASGEDGAGVITGEPKPSGKLGLVFSGQGTQRLGMGRELCARYPVFVDAFAEVCGALDEHLPAPIRNVILADPEGDHAGLLGRTGFAQPALFAIEVALYRLVTTFGLRPDVLAGHSIGEIAAVHVSGALTLPDAARLVCARARLMQALPAGGGMTAIQATESEVRESLAGLENRVVIAAINAARSVVISGEQAMVDRIAGHWREQGRRVSVLDVSHAFHSPLMDPMTAEFAAVLDTITWHEPEIRLVSTLTGAAIEPDRFCRTDYWVEQVRSAVRFADAVRALRDLGVTMFVEAGPSASLTPAISADDVVAVPLLHRTQPEPDALLTALSTLFVHGLDLDWTALFGAAAREVALPTYAFQRQRYWLRPAPGQSNDVASLGQDAVGHPMLGAEVGLAGGGAVVFTGRLSTAALPWLAEHMVAGTILLPGTGFVELALTAGDRVGTGHVEELTLQAPLALPAQGGVQLQVTVDAPDGLRRAVRVYSRPGAEDAWTCHATGTLTAAEPAADGLVDLHEWPPAGATPVDLTGRYAELAAHGYDYGPAFQGLRAAWRHGEDVFAEVELPGWRDTEPGRFGLHPALLDAGLQAIEFTADPTAEGDGGAGLWLPFSWSGVTLRATGASALRVCLRRRAVGAVSLAVADAAGDPILSVRELVLRPAIAPAARPLPGSRDLFRLDWIAPALPAEQSAEIESLSDVDSMLVRIRSGGVAPRHALLTCPTVSADVVAGAHAVTIWLLAALQQWLAAPELAGTGLIVVTSGAVAAGAEDVPNPAGAPVWGLVRSAQTEHPGRIVLVDADDSATLEATLPAVVASGEPQLALRNGALLAPRLSRVPATGGDTDWGDGTVLITGGTGTLGALVARHLVTEHGVRRLALLSRQGAPAAPDLVAELAAAGAQVDVQACDVTDRAALEAALTRITADGPVTGVVHTAGVVDDGVLGSLTPGQVTAVLAPKVNAAWHLHELTRGQPLSVFVLFSSSAAVFGGAGQANYAAGNAFLDALAAHRRAHGLPAQSLDWGLWAQPSGLTARLSDADVSRIGRGGVRAMASERALALLDAATGRDEAQLVPVQLDLDGLRAQFGPDGTPALFRALLPPARRRAGTGSEQGLARRLAALAPAERQRAVLDIVQTQVAAVLGHASARSVRSDQAFTDLGFDSLTAVELRNRLKAATGQDLPATLVFDYPTPAALVAHLLTGLVGTSVTPTAPTGVTASEEPIAIVGMSCRYPGGVGSPDELWDLVLSGGDGVGAFPIDRGWDLGQWLNPAVADGVAYTRQGGFLYDAGDFDAGFFGISPREAMAMDPQQRLLLETAWETFEQAGIDPASVRGSRTGVFAGVMYHDYGVGPQQVSEDGDTYVGSGSAGSVVSGRVAYTLGLEGPAVTVDTACSSSLVALHLAANALRQGECTMALAGGVTVMATPGPLMESSRQGTLSVDGRCKAFAAAADGAGFAEGVGVLLVERLSDAKRHGHTVLAVIRGSAVNQDGASNGLTAPNGPSQQRVIRQALAAAGLSTSDIEVVEAHGTGTKLGDPIEAQALLATYGQNRSADRPLLLGSIKSNIGHTQAAAGVAGVIKMVQALRHGTVPATLHVDAPTRHVDWTAGAVELTTQPRPWPAVPRPRRAAVSSFGISGTNAHLILEQAPPPTPNQTPPSALAPIKVPPVAPALVLQQASATEAVAAPVRAPAAVSALEQDRAVESAPGLAQAVPGVVQVAGAGAGGASVAEVGLVPWVVSARSEAGLRGQAGRLREFATRVELDVYATGAALVTTRARFDHRAVLLGRTQSEFLAALTAVAKGGNEVVTGSAGEPGRIGLVFAETPAEGLEVELCQRFPVYAEAVGEARTALGEHPHAATFATGIALHRLVTAFGVRPDVVTGTGWAAILAAHAAGALGLTDAARLVQAHGGPPEAYAAALADVDWQTPDIPVLSGHTGEPVDPQRLCSAHRPTSAVDPGTDPVAVLRAAGVNTVIGVGPVPDTVALLSGHRSFLTALATLFVSGVDVDWTAHFPARTPQVALPTYAFQHERYWLRPAAGDGADAWFWNLVERNDIEALADALGGADTWAPVLPLLSRWHRARRATSALDGHRYRIDWTVLPTSADASLAAVPGRPALWLVLDPGSAEAAECQRAITEHGGKAVRLPVRPDLSAEEIASLVKEQAVTDAIVGVLALFEPSARAPLPDVLELLPSVRWWSVTRSAVSAGADDPVRTPDQALAWGAGLVAGLEFPDRWGGLIDLPANGEWPRAGLATALAGATKDDQLALRPTGLFGRRLVRAATPARDWQPDGTVLVTGGTDEVAARVARGLAGRGVPHVVLLSENGPDPAELRADLAVLGAELTVTRCDPTDADALAQALDEVRPIRGVVHTLGGPDAHPSAVTVARHLDRLLDGEDLDLFVLYSSTAGVLGGPGQTEQAAADAFLDALAAHRRSRGLPATLLAWGPWAGEAGSAGVDPEAAPALFGADTSIVLADVDWAHLPPLLTTRRGLFLDALVRPGRAARQVESPDALRQRLSGRTEEEQRAVVLGLVTADLAAVLGHVSAEQVEPGRSFAEHGMDSMTGVELRDRLAERTGLTLPATTVFDFATPALLADHLLAGLKPERVPQPAATGTIDALYRQACADGKIADGMELVLAASKLRLSFDVSTVHENLPEPLRLAEGTTTPVVVCFPAMAATAGPHQYARFAGAFRGRRQVNVLPMPGFVRGERLPSTMDALLDAQAEAVLRCTGDSPAVLLGHSAGGWIANAVAHRLAELGASPAGVVLLDSIAPGADISAEDQFGMVGMMFDKEREMGASVIDDVRLTAMGGYHRIFADWTVPPLDCPVLYVRAADPMFAAPAAHPAWPLPHELTEVAGNHFTMLEEHARSTAAAVDSWLNSVSNSANIENLVPEEER
jgi:acyl transferase domain-containing protein/acyl carrier protein/thioesterase domain-containing protein